MAVYGIGVRTPGDAAGAGDRADAETEAAREAAREAASEGGGAIG